MDHKDSVNSDAQLSPTKHEIVQDVLLPEPEGLGNSGLGEVDDPLPYAELSPGKTTERGQKRKNSLPVLPESPQKVLSSHMSSTRSLGETIRSNGTPKSPAQSVLRPIQPSVRRAYATDLRFWTVWRVLGAMFGGIFGGTILLILSLVAAVYLEWSEVSIGLLNLSLMTIICVFLNVSVIYSILRITMNRAGERTREQAWVVILVLVCWAQPYLNPIPLGLLWSNYVANSTSLEIERGYTISNPRISGFFSTLLVTFLYFFCFHEIQRFREERLYYRRTIVFLYFILRMSFTQAAAMDMGSVPGAQLCTLIRFMPSEGSGLPVARVVGIVLVSFLDGAIWLMNLVYHRNTRSKIMHRLYDEDEKARTVQYGLSVITTVLWTTQIFFASLIVVVTPPIRQHSYNLSFSGTSVNTIGCCAAFLLLSWVMALAFANFPLTSPPSPDEATRTTDRNSSGRRKIRVRFYVSSRDVPPWAVLVVNGRRCFPTKQRAMWPPPPLPLGERQSSIVSQDADVAAEHQTLTTLAKNLLTKSLSSVGEAITGDASTLVLDSTPAPGTTVNFVVEHACECLNFSNIAYNTGNALNPQTNAQVQLLVEDPAYIVYRQVSSTVQDVHAVIFVSKDTIIVAFRGTHSSQNVRTDAAFNSKKHTSSLDWEYDSGSAWARRFTPEVHAGFRQAYASVRSSLLACLEELIHQDPTRVCRLCGHSMGGSLACLLAFDVRRKLISDPSRIQVFTFGSSRLGNESFRVRYNDAVPQTFSLVCAGDPVSKLPPRIPFGLPLGYKHHGIAVLLLANGSLIVTPSRAELAVLHTYAPNDWDVHRVRAYAQSMMRWCVLNNVQDEFRPFWNSIVSQVHRLPLTTLRNRVLLSYLLHDPALVENALAVGNSKNGMQKLLTDALTRRPFSPSSSPSSTSSSTKGGKAESDQLSVIVNVSAVRLPIPRVVAPPTARTPGAGGPNRKQMLGELIGRPLARHREETERRRSSVSTGHGEVDTLDSTTMTARGVTFLPSDIVFVAVTCGSVEEVARAEDEAVDEPEQISPEASRAVGEEPWVRLPDRALVFGGTAQTLRPEVDKLTFKIFKRAIECQCEAQSIISRLRSLPASASNVLATHNTSETITLLHPACDLCASPRCVAQSELTVASVFGDSGAPSASKEVVLSAVPLPETMLGENVLVKVRVWATGAMRIPPSAPVYPQDEDDDQEQRGPKMRTAGDLPLYDTTGLLTLASAPLFPAGFYLRVRVLTAVGAPYRAVTNSFHRLGAALAGGTIISCSVAVSGQTDKFQALARKAERVNFAPPENPPNESMLHAVAAKFARTASILENVSSMTQGITGQKVLRVEFARDAIVFGGMGLSPGLTGYEEVVIKLRSRRRRHARAIRFRQGSELGGYVVADLHRALRLIAAQKGEATTVNQALSFARWFPLRGPGACGKVLVALEFVPLAGPDPIATVSREDEYADAEDDSSVASPQGTMRVDLKNTVRTSQYRLDLLLSGLRYLPAEFGRVAIAVHVRDDYNPRNQGPQVRTAWIDYGGVVAGWTFTPQGLALGGDPATSLEGSEVITIRILDALDATIAKREFKIRDLLADFGEGHHDSSSTIVSLLAWVVIPFKSPVHAGKRAPEIKASFRINHTDQTLPVTALNLL